MAFAVAQASHTAKYPPVSRYNPHPPEITRSQNPQKVAGQLYRDFTLSHDITFSCFTLDRGRGRKPVLVNSFDQYRRSVERARRLVRDI